METASSIAGSGKTGLAQPRSALPETRSQNEGTEVAFHRPAFRWLTAFWGGVYKGAAILLDRGHRVF